MHESERKEFSEDLSNKTRIFWATYFLVSWSMHCSMEMPSTTVFGFSRKPCVFTRRQAACLHAAYLQNSFWRSRKQTKVTCWVWFTCMVCWVSSRCWVYTKVYHGIGISLWLTIHIRLSYQFLSKKNTIKLILTMQIVYNIRFTLINITKQITNFTTHNINTSCKTLAQ